MRTPPWCDRGFNADGSTLHTDKKMLHVSREGGLTSDCHRNQERSINMEGYQWQRNLHSCFIACGGKGRCYPTKIQGYLYKQKGNSQVFDNHRGISLLSVAGRTLAQILSNRLNVHLDHAGLLPESQCGFRTKER